MWKRRLLGLRLVHSRHEQQSWLTEDAPLHPPTGPGYSYSGASGQSIVRSQPHPALEQPAADTVATTPVPGCSSLPLAQWPRHRPLCSPPAMRQPAVIGQAEDRQRSQSRSSKNGSGLEPEENEGPQKFWHPQVSGFRVEFESDGR